ncbi:MAG: hypothetical protein M1129_04020 [Candidatus Thermoplasmatota archaeon]|jgi:hypothetical protein|nr:hypothetical protein [Candidatus Thermoplasmatota archaeon]MCL5955251.1 hypothetical protein [Candidatus Thermoplasmatota archaeon]
MDKYQRLSMFLGILTMLLGIQFLIGMYINLYIALPVGTHSFAGYITENGIVAAHIFMAFLIVVLDFFAFFMAIHARIGNLYILSVLLSLVSIVISGISGMIFLMGGQNNAYSFAMAVFFLLAYGFIGFGMVGVRKAKS